MHLQKLVVDGSGRSLGLCTGPQQRLVADTPVQVCYQSDGSEADIHLFTQSHSMKLNDNYSSHTYASASVLTT